MVKTGNSTVLCLDYYENGEPGGEHNEDAERGRKVTVYGKAVNRCRKTPKEEEARQNGA